MLNTNLAGAMSRLLADLAGGPGSAGDKPGGVAHQVTALEFADFRAARSVR